LKLHPFFPNLLPAFIFLLRKKINAIQILKKFSMHRYICHFYLPTRIGNRALVKNTTKYISYCLYFKAENKFIFCFFAA
ncbi:MAG: hypothetical protein IKA65_03695, partial [Lentisphaeria bacterium]|nr:hypothetical protein [Lentisphaeria bacterium]